MELFKRMFCANNNIGMKDDNRVQNNFFQNCTKDAMTHFYILLTVFLLRRDNDILTMATTSYPRF